MASLEFLVSFRDQASPGLRRLAENADKLQRSLGGVGSASSGANAALSKGITRAVSLLRRVGEGIESLVTLRAVTAVAAGAFGLLATSASLAVQAVGATATAVGVFVNVMQTLLSVLNVVVPFIAKRALAAFIALIPSIGVVGAGVAIIVGGLAAIVLGFYALREAGPAILDALSAAFQKLGRWITDLALTFVPAFTKGIVDGLLVALRSLLDVIGEFLPDSIRRFAERLAGIDIKGFAAGIGEAGGELAGFAGEVGGDFLSEFGDDLDDLVKNLLPGVLNGFSALTGAVGGTIDALKALRTLNIETVFGQLALAPEQVRKLFVGVAQQVEAGVELTDAALIRQLTNLRGNLSSALLTLYDNLPNGLQQYFEGAILELSNSNLKAQLELAVNDFFSVLAEPANLAALQEGNITPQLEASVLAFQDAQGRIIAIREETLKRLGLLDETAADRKARTQSQAAFAEIRNFLQTSQRLAKEHKNASIALATADAAVAITGAFKHGTGFGPVYLGAYVASVVASLGATIRSLRSGNVPSIVGGGAAGLGNTNNTTNNNNQQEVNIYFQGGLGSNAALSLSDADRLRQAYDNPELLSL